MANNATSIKQPEISIIIPVCELDEKTSRCLESISHQTLRNIEVLIMHDIEDCKRLASLCDKYFKNDGRVSVVQSQKHGAAALCNEAISIAKGRYIGFVMAFDWVEPEMYESLNSQALKHDTDVVYSFIYVHKNTKKVDMEWVNSPHICNTLIDDKWRNPDLYLKGPGITGSIIRRDFLAENKISFDESARNLDIAVSGFSFLVFNLMSSFFILRGAFCHHELHDNAYDIKDAIGLIDEHAYIASHIKERKFDKKSILLEAAKAFLDLKNVYNTRCSSYKQKKFLLNYAVRLLKTLAQYIDETNFLDKQDKKLAGKFFNHPNATAFFDKQNLHIKALRFLVDIKLSNCVSYLRVFRFPLFFIKISDSYSTFNFCKVPLRRVKTRTYEGDTKKTKYYYLWIPLFKRTETKEAINSYLLNIRISKKINLEAQLLEINKAIRQLPSHADIVYYSGMLNIVSEIHSRTFPQFKNSNTGRSIAILGTGPSFNFAPEIINSKIIACNRSFMLIGNKEPDYIFAHDYVDAQDYFYEMLKKNCPIFLGQFIHKLHNDTVVAPEKIKTQKNVYTYYSGYPYHKSIRTEIECFPLYTIATIIDPALHFALYTNPDVVYLIGCDASLDGYANKNLIQYTNTPIYKIIDAHIKFRQFRDTHYPNTKIISVNPLGLRGIYDDVYTEDFLKEHSEIDSSSVKVIKDI